MHNAAPFGVGWERALFLKSLDVFGFKSFAERTRIEFADGITALLGPNGCGKSNVVDAIRWVLGEQGVRSLRAEKMEDMIFNGTENRKPLNVAEVSLTLANESGLLPMDMPEIQIKRRLYRSGESEYFINTTLVKLKEIRELFWDTGVGKAAYSVMEQGKIDQVLSSKPEDRRYLFEEAAGITRYKVKGAEAERKLAKTEENMRQVEGILGEVKRSYDTLKSQSDKTQRYRALREAIFAAELDIQLLRLRQFWNNRDVLAETLRTRIQERDAIQGELDGITRSLEQNMDLVNSLEEQLIELQKTIYGLALEKNAREKEAKLLAEQYAETKNAIEQNQSRERAIGTKITDLIEDAEEQDGVVQDLRKKVQDIGDNIHSFQENIQLAAFRINENNDRIRQKEEQIRSLEAEREALETALEGITDDIVAELDAGLKDAGYSAVERRNAEEALANTLSLLSTILTGRGALLSDFAAGPAPSEEEHGRFAQNLAEALGEAAGYAAEAQRIFQEYRKTAPVFLDEFLAPEGIITQKRALDGKIRLAKEGVVERQSQIQAIRLDTQEISARIDEYRKTLEDLRVNQTRMHTQAEAAAEQAKLMRRELAGQEALQKTIQDELFLSKKRLEDIGERIHEAEEDIGGIEKRGLQLTADLAKLEKELAKRNGDVAGNREFIKKRQEALAKAQGAVEKTRLEQAQLETEIKNIQDNFRETHSRDLLEYEEHLYTITTSQEELRENLAQARGQLRELGQVNLMAPEEFAETKERYDFLTTQLGDLRKAREDLATITAEIRAESSELFMQTYNKIRKNFHNMFRRLFGGGRTELRLQDVNHVLESGIEIYAQPPGKKLENINLLSGGERSMTAVALLFATYMVKPSPFCLLDEIDAALDEDNVSRFVQTLREFSRSSQFIVITHNKKTVIGATTLLGVTMEESGVSKIVSVRLEGELPMPEPLYGDFEEEDVEEEKGWELPVGVDDPSGVDAKTLRPISYSQVISGSAGESENS